MNKNKYSGGGGFPNQFAPDEQKASLEYGLRVGLFLRLLLVLKGS